MRIATEKENKTITPTLMTNRYLPLETIKPKTTAEIQCIRQMLFTQIRCEIRSANPMKI
jgi:hypothetical protein